MLRIEKRPSVSRKTAISLFFFLEENRSLKAYLRAALQRWRQNSEMLNFISKHALTTVKLIHECFLKHGRDGYCTRKSSPKFESFSWGKLTTTVQSTQLAQSWSHSQCFVF